MSTQSCIELINEKKRKLGNRYEDSVRKEFENQSVLADWGNQKTYIVTEVDFSTNPMKHKFDFKGENISIAEYFKRTYNKVVRDFDQPLFIVKNQNGSFHLPPEFCKLDGVTNE
jgi:hypothetical protein